MALFASVLRELRNSRGLTQHELAKQTGILRSRISMYELGQREPDFAVLEQLADFFNVDVDYLLGRTNKTTVLPQSSLTAEEQELLIRFRKLNASGKAKVMEQIDDMIGLPKYTSRKSSVSAAG